MLGHAGEEREGILLRRLKGVGQGGRTGRFGFATGEDGGKRRPMVIVARVPHGNALTDDLSAMAEAGADGIEIAVHTGSAVGDITEAAAGVQVPCGVFIAGGDRDWSAMVGTERFDWIHLAAAAQAHMLAGKGPTRLISLSTNEPPGRLAGLSGLHADAIVVEDQVSGDPFTVDTLLALCAIQAATKRPLLAGSSLTMRPDDVAVLHDHGIEGVLVRGDVAAVRAFVKAVEAL